MTEASDLRSCQVLRPLAPWLFVPSMLTQASSEEDRLLPKEQADYTHFRRAGLLLIGRARLCALQGGLPKTLSGNKLVTIIRENWKHGNAERCRTPCRSGA